MLELSNLYRVDFSAFFAEDGWQQDIEAWKEARLTKKGKERKEKKRKETSRMRRDGGKRSEK